MRARVGIINQSDNFCLVCGKIVNFDVRFNYSFDNFVFWDCDIEEK